MGPVNQMLLALTHFYCLARPHLLTEKLQLLPMAKSAQRLLLLLVQPLCHCRHWLLLLLCAASYMQGRSPASPGLHQTHNERWKYSSSTSEAHAKAPQNAMSELDVLPEY